MNLGFLGYNQIPVSLSESKFDSDVSVFQYQTAKEFQDQSPNDHLCMLVSKYHIDDTNIIEVLSQDGGILQQTNLVVTDCGSVAEAVMAMQHGAKEALASKAQQEKLMQLVIKYAVN
ncbi:hypothetical protein [Motilimonas pumila]|nr:hypothetical protein [Motilimonas pumila]